MIWVESKHYVTVKPTDAEKAEWDRRRTSRARHYPYRICCTRCGKRMWLSGIGWGAHKRSCKPGLTTAV